VRRAILAVLLVLLLAGIAATAWAVRHAEIAAIEPPEPASLDAGLVERGEMLAAIGGCASCHADSDGALSGGRRLETPFGAIYSTNITPDPGAGIGTWSEAALRRAMREGVDRAGRHLYPAFPYDHYTLTSDADIAAIYAWLMSRPAVAAETPANGLSFPFNIRWLLAGWKLLYLETGPFEPDPARDERWNRGAYLVEGPGHCAACHSPRNRLGARDRARDYAGGEAEGWHAPALDASSPAPVPWDADALINYLYDGWDETHGIAAGPMAEVVANIGGIAESDMEAIAAYLLSLQERQGGGEGAGDAAMAFARRVAFGAPDEPAPPPGPALRRGLEIFAARCADCHRAASETVPLALATTVAGPDPRNIIRIILDGVKPSENAYFVRPMPGFRTLTDAEIVDLVRFIRDRFADQPAWTGLEAAVAETRAGGEAPPAQRAGAAAKP